jgi:hypothetical protein
MFSLLGDDLTELKFKLSVDCQAKKQQYELQVDEDIDAATHPVNINRLDLAHDQYHTFIKFGDAIDRLLRNGRDPDYPLQPTPLSNIFLLKILPWYCYFRVRRAGNRGCAEGVVLFKNIDKPRNLAELLASFSKQWLA